MTISTGDGLVAGIIGVPTIIGKDSASNEAAGISHTPWYASGIIGAGAAPTGGLNGVTFSGTVNGQIPIPAAAAGKQSYVERLSLVHTGGIGHIWVVDRLWGNVPVVPPPPGRQSPHPHGRPGTPARAPSAPACTWPSRSRRPQATRAPSRTRPSSTPTRATSAGHAPPPWPASPPPP